MFFTEWRSRAEKEHRSLDRARHLLELIDCRKAAAPVLTVVGSKGKGTAATYASAYLGASGARVVTVTSPGLRSNRERIRVDGTAISMAELKHLSERIAKGIRKLPSRHKLPGYLAPAGLFTIAGVLHAREVGADIIVLEAGMGGGSDEVALFPPCTVAIAEIFGEHLGVLGNTPAEIAREKALVVTGETEAVLSLPQQPAVLDAISDTVRNKKGDMQIEIVDSRAGELPPTLLPPSYGRWNAELGCAAASRMLSLLDRDAPGPARLQQVLESIRLPGRLSFHPLPGSGTELCVDSAISRAGIATALTMARQRWGTVDHVVVCLPDHKDVSGAIAELAELPVTFVRLALPHLRFTTSLPDHWVTVNEQDLTREFLSTRGGHVLTLGTVYFSGKVLDVIDAPTERLFIIPS